MGKNCKVVSTFFGAREVRNIATDCDGTISLLEGMIEKEKSTDAGVHCDTILVNHLLEKDNEKPLEFLDSINGTQLKNGKLITMNRPWDNGKGYGFKSRDYAFKKYQDEYEHWFFAEDDLNFFQDNYYKKCIDVLEAGPKVAFVCTLHNAIAQTDAAIVAAGFDRQHCHGGEGCTHVRFLKEVVEFNDKNRKSSHPDTQGQGHYGRNLPYADSADFGIACHFSEVEFTNILTKMGYALAVVGEQVHDTDYWSKYDHQVYGYEQRGKRW
ncbi:hypothetical protein CMI37_33760 [Candidatus Pacearchaeota archaeon]|nr:hypothetical protein [Candidatus Pacearchaeota archaeon]|tara:strand:+ start:774 stop:1577 length:804 start_codon:yes stop_codon:yes gene_type:complete